MKNPTPKAVRKRSVLGYGFKLSKESVQTALSMYDGDYRPSPKAVLKEIEHARREEYIGKASKPRIFRIVVEELK